MQAINLIAYNVLLLELSRFIHTLFVHLVFSHHIGKVWY